MYNFHKKEISGEKIKNKKMKIKKMMSKILDKIRFRREIKYQREQMKKQVTEGEIPHDFYLKIKDKTQDLFKMKKGDLNYVFYRYYYNFIGEDCITCLPDYLFYGYIFQKISDLSFCKIFDNKNFYSLYFPNVLMPIEIAKVNNGICFDGKNNHISFEHMLMLLRDKTKYIIKPSVGSSCGNNIVILKGEEREKVSDYFSKFKDFIIQEFIEQSDKMGAFSKQSVNTFRVHSIFHENETTIISACLRFGKGDSSLDNLYQDGAFIPIDINESKFWNFAINNHGNKVLDANGYEFRGKKVDFLPAIFDVIKKMHPLLSKSKIIAWDFAINKSEEPVLIEFNLGVVGVRILQICSKGHPFGKYTEQLYKTFLPMK